MLHDVLQAQPLSFSSSHTAYQSQSHQPTSVTTPLRHFSNYTSPLQLEINRHTVSHSYTPQLTAWRQHPDAHGPNATPTRPRSRNGSTVFGTKKSGGVSRCLQTNESHSKILTPLTRQLRTSQESSPPPSQEERLPQQGQVLLHVRRHHQALRLLPLAGRGSNSPNGTQHASETGCGDGAAQDADIDAAGSELVWHFAV